MADVIVMRAVDPGAGRDAATNAATSASQAALLKAQIDAIVAALPAQINSLITTQAATSVAAATASQVPPAVAAAVLSQVSPAVAAEVLSQVSPAVAAAVLSQVTPAVAAAVLAQVSPAVAAAVLSQVTPAVSAKVTELIDPKVTAAANSAILANTRAGDAETARAAAVTAKTDAETARGTAVIAKDAAALSATTAGTGATTSTTKATEAANSAAAASAIVTALPATVPMMAGFMFSPGLYRYYQQYGALKSTVALSLTDVLTISRASKGCAFDGTGTLVEFANNVARVGSTVQNASQGFIIEPTLTNDIRNPRGEGIGTGTITTNAAANGGQPTYWNRPNGLPGIAMDVSPITTSGMTGMRVRIYGTKTSGTYTTLEFESRAALSAVAAMLRTGLVLARIGAGNLTNISSVALAITGVTSGNVAVVNNAGLTEMSTTLDGTLRPFRVSQLFTSDLNAGNPVAMCGFGVRVTPTTNLAVDITLDLFVPTCVQGWGLLTPILPVAGSPLAASRLADAAVIPDPAKVGWTNGGMAVALRLMIPILPPAGTIAGLWRSDDTTDNERVRLWVDSTGAVTLERAVGGVASTVSLGTVTGGTSFRVAAEFGDALLRGCINGGTVVAATGLVGRPYGMNRPRLGSSSLGGSTELAAALIYEVALRQGGLSSAELQGLLS